MRGRLLALAVGALLLGAGPAAAEASQFGGQSAEQSAGSMQSATSGATSTQDNPSNENISVRVLSPGSDGSVSQSNSSHAESGAANLNSTGQALSQDQSGSGTSCCNAGNEAMQQAEQWAANAQSANSTATSTQKDPSNQNISVRVLSPGDNGSVDQSNSSDAKSFAGNMNHTQQQTQQSQGSSAASPVKVAPSTGSSGLMDGRGGGSCGCGSGSEAIQAAGQDALNKQSAKSTATSTQIAPSNENISVRVLSPGGNGSVSQSNSSDAKSFAGNANHTMQSIDQTQPGASGCGCVVPLLVGPCCSGHSTGIQAAGQDALNMQDANSTATSQQFMPSNVNKSLRLKDLFGIGGRPSPCGCDSNGPPSTPGTGVLDGQSTPVDGSGGQLTPVDGAGGQLTPIDGAGGQVSQDNSSKAKSKALNLNDLWQQLAQSQGSSGGDVLTT